MTRRWTPTCRTANSSKARFVKRSKTASCASSISRLSIAAAGGWSASKRWRAGSIRCCNSGGRISSRRLSEFSARPALRPTSSNSNSPKATLLGNLESAELSMLRLKGVGVCFALDDFGTGYSSLLYLRRFPFDKLKIDSSFVRSIEKAADAAAIVHAVVSLGRGLGMKVTAEGVETAERHLFLRAAGVHSMQGYASAGR